MATSNLPSRTPYVIGDSHLSSFDVCIVGSGAGGSSAARALALAGLKVLILEIGSNHFVGLDDPRPDMPTTLFNNDELKSELRSFFLPDPVVRPRTFRPADYTGARTGIGDVNALPQLVGGGQVHADVKSPRFAPFDFQLGTLLGDVANASFADWPIDYDALEPFYVEAETIAGVQGDPSQNPFDPPRSQPYPLPPGVQMYVANVIAEGARKVGLHPYPLPTAVLSRPYRGRPACNDCGFCGDFGCPINAKSPAGLVALRDALLTGNVQLRHNCTVKRLIADDGRHVTAVEYLDPQGNVSTASADRYILAASPIEDARIAFLSADGGLGNSSGMVGRNLMFHFSTIVVGIYRQKMHGQRGRSVSTGWADFRGRPNDPQHPLGGTIEISGGANPIAQMAGTLPFALLPRGLGLKKLMRDSPFGERFANLQMLSEDAPQVTNRIDLDPDVRDAQGIPVARVSYSNHPFELSAWEFYAPKMLEVHRAAGAELGFIVPRDLLLQGPDSMGSTRHIMGTLRMGNDPRTSVCDASGRFHDVDNLYAVDGALFPTASGYNPTLTIEAVAIRVAGGIVSPGNPERVLTPA